MSKTKIPTERLAQINANRRDAAIEANKPKNLNILQKMAAAAGFGAHEVVLPGDTSKPVEAAQPIQVDIEGAPVEVPVHTASPAGFNLPALRSDLENIPAKDLTPAEREAEIERLESRQKEDLAQDGVAAVRRVAETFPGEELDDDVTSSDIDQSALAMELAPHKNGDQNQMRVDSQYEGAPQDGDDRGDYLTGFHITKP